MDLQSLVSKPKLVLVTLPKVELPKLDEKGNRVLVTTPAPKLKADGTQVLDDDGKVVMTKVGDDEIYFDDITFYTPDRQPLDVYLQLSLNLAKDQHTSIELIKKLILNEKGEQVIVDDRIPPINVMVLAMAKVMELLGK